MSSRVRLLPALIGATGVLLTLRLGAMASSTEPSPPADHGAAEATAPVSEVKAAEAGETKVAEAGAPSAPAEAAPASAPPTATSQPALAPAGQAQTKGEAEVLQNLTQRRNELDALARDLSLREQLMAATERQVTQRLTELKDLETKLGVMLAQRDAAEEAQIASLVKTYENMKPTDAAKIFNKLDRQITLMVAQRMKPAKIAVVMAAMDPARAQDLTVMLATRMKLAKPAPVEPAAPPPVAPPASEAQPQAAAAPAAPPAT